METTNVRDYYHLRQDITKKYNYGIVNVLSQKNPFIQYVEEKSVQKLQL